MLTSFMCEHFVLFSQIPMRHIDAREICLPVLADDWMVEIEPQHSTAQIF